MTYDELECATDFAGLAEWLRRPDDGYPVHEVVEVRCDCGHRVFGVLVDQEQGAAQRVCVRCKAEVCIADSADHLDEAELGECECPCGGDEFEVGVGFSLHPDGEVRWITVGLRCIADGMIGIYTDWKIDYGPSAHLMGEC